MVGDIIDYLVTNNLLEKHLYVRGTKDMFENLPDLSLSLSLSKLYNSCYVNVKKIFQVISKGRRHN